MTIQTDDLVKKAFDRYDTNNSGYIDIGELKHLLNELATNQGGGTITDAQVEEIMKFGDKQGDGKLSYEEFLNLAGPYIDKKLDKNKNCFQKESSILAINTVVISIAG